MGVPFSLLARLGFPSVDSVATDRFYNEFFSNVKDFDEFHANFIDMCSKINEVMPGKHYIIKANKEEIKTFYEKEWKAGAAEGKDKESKKKLLIEFTKGKVQASKFSTLMITTGCVAPAAAVLLKRSGEKVPQLKKLRIDVVPDFVFVPGVTLLSLIGVRMLGLSKAMS